MNLEKMTLDELKNYKKELQQKLKEVKDEIKKRPPSYSVRITDKMHVYIKYSLKNKKESKYIGLVSEETIDKLKKIDKTLVPKYLEKLKKLLENN